MMREVDWGLFKKLFPIFWTLGMVAYLYGWVDYYIVGEQRVGWNSWLLLPLLNAIGQVGLSAAVLAAVCVIWKGLLAKAPAVVTAKWKGKSTRDGLNKSVDCSSTHRKLSRADGLFRASLVQHRHPSPVVPRTTTTYHPVAPQRQSRTAGRYRCTTEGRFTT